MLCNERLQFTDDLGMATQGQIGFDPFLDPDQAQLVEPGDLLLGESLVGEVSQRRPTPQGKGVAEDLGGSVGITLAESRSSLIEHRPETIGVELPRVESKDVPRWPSQDGYSGGVVIAVLRGKRSAQLRDVTLHELCSALRRRLAPQTVDQTFSRDDLVSMHE